MDSSSTDVTPNLGWLTKYDYKLAPHSKIIRDFIPPTLKACLFSFCACYHPKAKAIDEIGDVMSLMGNISTRGQH